MKRIVDLSYAGYSLLDKWLHLKRARARLARECEVFGVELKFLKIRSENPDKIWAYASYRHLFAAKAYENKGEIQGGWVSLYAAQRLTVFGLDQDELINRAEILRLETKKILSWRADAILGLLSR